MRQLVVRTLVGMVGWAVILLGLVMIPYPGPGWLVVFAGLAILARQYVWARRTLDFAHGKYTDWEMWVRVQPLYIKLLLSVLTGVTVVVTLWLVNGYGLMNDWFNLGMDWLRSPFVR